MANGGVGVESSAVNKIVLGDESEGDKRVDDLEKEVLVLKGSIKKLIIDIREQMNNAENPFLNIQQIRDIPPVKPPVDIPDEDEEDEIKASPAVPEKPEDQDHKMPDLQQLQQMADEKSRILDKLKAVVAVEDTHKDGPIDPQTMTQLMKWTRNMLHKNGIVRFNDLMEMYQTMGYIDDRTRDMINKVSRLMESEPQETPKQFDIKECVSDLYALFIIMSPRDKALDSAMVSVLLNCDETQRQIS